MSTRIPPQPRDKLPNEQQDVYDKLVDRAGKGFGDTFTWKREDGALVGPFPFLLAQPAAGQQYFDLVSKFSSIPGLPPDARETAILTVGSTYKAAYKVYAHAAVAKKSTQLEDHQVDDICAGKRPGSLNPACDVAYDVANHLSTTPGPLPQEIWDRSIKVLGKDGTVALVHYVGVYAYTCMILNAIDAPAPKEGKM